MGMKDFLKPPSYSDPALGTLVRRRGYWQGEIDLQQPPGPVPLLLSGSRTAPDESGSKLARELVRRYPDLRPDIERSLFEHYEPYAEAAESDNDGPLADIPRLSAPDQVWKHVSLVRVLIEPIERLDTVEIAFKTGWDIEHTVGRALPTMEARRTQWQRHLSSERRGQQRLAVSRPESR